MLMAYLPQEKILIEADLYTAPRPNAPPPAAPSASSLTLYENVKRYKLDVSTLAPLHGARTVPWAEFARAIGKPE